MSETVFILGAGVSKQAGAPLMGDFLDRAERLMRYDPELTNDDSFCLVFKALAELQVAHAKADLDLDNLESAFAAFDMARLTRRLGSLTQDEVEKLTPAMERVIAVTLERSIGFEVKGRRLAPPTSYGQFCQLMSKLGLNPAAVSIITFNYDLCLDACFYTSGKRVDYCLDQNSENDAGKLLKLHGSLNWAYCSECGSVFARGLDDKYRSAVWTQDTIHDVPLNIVAELPRHHHCNHVPQGPVVVPPSWNKGPYYASIESVWRAAAKELSEAENIYVLGYSLPDTDQFFRYLYGIGSIGRSRLKRFWVFDPDKAVADRFQRLLGLMARKRFQFWQKTFSDACGDLRGLI